MGTYDTIGETPRHDPMFDESGVCERCGCHPDECKCPECKVCGMIGCPDHFGREERGD